MTTKHRGVVKIEGPEDQLYHMCLTLGAIAEIEEGLGVASLTQMDEVFEKGSMKDVLTILLALLHGGGHKAVKREDMIDWEVEFPVLMDKIQECFKAAGFGDEEESKDEGTGSEETPKGN